MDSIILSILGIMYVGFGYCNVIELAIVDKRICLFFLGTTNKGAAHGASDRTINPCSVRYYTSTCTAALLATL